MNAKNQVQFLENALRELWGPGFDDEMRALVEREAWYHSAIPSSEIFMYRVRDHLQKGDDPLWVFESLRMSERKFLADKLGIERSHMIGLSPMQLARAILNKLGIPETRIGGVCRVVVDPWREMTTLIERGEDERAAVYGRQKAERLLRTLLYFYCHCGLSQHQATVLSNPGSLRIPDKLKKILPSISAASQEAVLSKVLQEDGWADLGFLTIFCRRLSSAAESASVRHITGEMLTLLTANDQETLDALARALQSYAHDKPTKSAVRSQELHTAVSGMVRMVEAMVSRRIIPDVMVVLEKGDSVLGPIFRGVIESGKQVRLTTEQAPEVGSRILFIQSALRDDARAQWCMDPWPIERQN